MRQAGRRGGFALIEMLATITVLAALLGLCVGTIHLMMKLDRSGRAAGDEAADLFRLARDFRDDAHRAADAEPPAPSSERVAFTLDDGRSVSYEVRPGDLLRTVKRGDRVVGRETYRRSPRGTVAFEVDRALASRPLAILRLGRPPDGQPGGPLRVQEIAAEFARDRRLSGGPR